MYKTKRINLTSTNRTKEINSGGYGFVIRSTTPHAGVRVMFNRDEDTAMNVLKDEVLRVRFNNLTLQYNGQAAVITVIIFDKPDDYIQFANNRSGLVRRAGENVGPSENGQIVNGNLALASNTSGSIYVVPAGHIGIIREIAVTTFNRTTYAHLTIFAKITPTANHNVSAKTFSLYYLRQTLSLFNDIVLQPGGEVGYSATLGAAPNDAVIHSCIEQLPINEDY